MTPIAILLGSLAYILIMTIVMIVLCLRHARFIKRPRVDGIPGERYEVPRWVHAVFIACGVLLSLMLVYAAYLSWTKQPDSGIISIICIAACLTISGSVYGTWLNTCTWAFLSRTTVIFKRGRRTRKFLLSEIKCTTNMSFTYLLRFKDGRAKLYPSELGLNSRFQGDLDVAIVIRKTMKMEEETPHI